MPAPPPQCSRCARGVLSDQALDRLSVQPFGSPTFSSGVGAPGWLLSRAIHRMTKQGGFNWNSLGPTRKGLVTFRCWATEPPTPNGQLSADLDGSQSGSIGYSSTKNHEPSSRAISFRQIVTSDSEASQVKRSRTGAAGSDSKTSRSWSIYPR